jgi:hypothetical protein
MIHRYHIDPAAVSAFRTYLISRVPGILSLNRRWRSISDWEGQICPSNMSEQGIPGLLRLSRELRDHIYSYLLHEYAEPPPNPSFPGERITSKHDGSGVRGLQVFSISYPKNPRRCQYVGLLRTNHQLRDEVMECVDRCLTSGNTTAKLDIMCKGYQVCQTDG